MPPSTTIVRTLALTKKGLRRGSLSVADVLSTSPNACPDEEGIKTDFLQQFRRQAMCPNACPDEEGIKTSAHFAEQYRRRRVRTLALTKKGLRRGATQVDEDGFPQSERLP